jgi:ABC-type antimicrobial peptide transport system permease subunit
LLRTIDPELPLYQVATVSDEVDDSLWQERLLAALTSCFGAFALALSAIGLYGIMAHFVGQREREIGLHMALGANSREVVHLVVRRVIPALGMGILAGAALSWLASAWVRSLLFGVQAFDPVTGGATILLFAVIGSGAAILPALRAIGVDPVVTLREQ